MNTYTVQVTVRVDAESENMAYRFIKTALNAAKQTEIIYEDAEVIDTLPIEGDD